MPNLLQFFNPANQPVAPQGQANPANHNVPQGQANPANHNAPQPQPAPHPIRHPS